MDANYHTHTFRCGHARGSDEQYVRAAIEAGFRILGFSDHVPYVGIHAPQDRMEYDQIEEYLTSIAHLKAKYADQIDIKVGYEIEFFPDHLEYYKELLKRVDYLILGQHNLVLNSHELDCYADDQDVLGYTELVLKAIDSGLISFLAHPDYFMLGRRDWSQVCIESSHKICAAAAKAKIPLELNLNGIRYGHKSFKGGKAYVYPYRAFWEIAAQYDTICVYGYDAHHPTTLLEHDRIDTINEIIKGIPLNIIENYRF
jgi:histidinol-phosphatase (PHP family)